MMNAWIVREWDTLDNNYYNDDDDDDGVGVGDADVDDWPFYL